MDTEKTRQITLTGRPPVSIVEAEWPQIAVARSADGRSSVRVREHEDGRRLVYGVAAGQASDRGLSSSAATRRAGQLLAARTDLATDPTVRTIHAIAAAIGCAELADVCIGALPSEVL